MTYMFLVLNKDSVQLFERNREFKCVQLTLHCEQEMHIMPGQFAQAGNDMRTEIIDNINSKDLSRVRLLLLYQQVTNKDLLQFVNAFHDLEMFQLVTVANVLNFIAVQKKLYGTEDYKCTKKLYMGYEQGYYEMKFNEHHYFEVRSSSMAPVYKISTNELLKFANVLSAQ